MLSICPAISFTLYLVHCSIFFGWTYLLRRLDQLTKNTNNTSVTYLSSHLFNFISLSLPYILWIGFLTEENSSVNKNIYNKTSYMFVKPSSSVHISFLVLSSPWRGFLAEVKIPKVFSFCAHTFIYSTIEILADSS